MSKATLSAFVIGCASNAAWLWSDPSSWSAFGWIIIALLTILIGLAMELVWHRR